MFDYLLAKCVNACCLNFFFLCLKAKEGLTFLAQEVLGNAILKRVNKKRISINCFADVKQKTSFVKRIP